MRLCSVGAALLLWSISAARDVHVSFSADTDKWSLEDLATITDETVRQYIRDNFGIVPNSTTAIATQAQNGVSGSVSLESLPRRYRSAAASILAVPPSLALLDFTLVGSSVSRSDISSAVVHQLVSPRGALAAALSAAQLPLSHQRWVTASLTLPAPSTAPSLLPSASKATPMSAGSIPPSLVALRQTSSFSVGMTLTFWSGVAGDVFEVFGALAVRPRLLNLSAVDFDGANTSSQALAGAATVTPALLHSACMGGVSGAAVGKRVRVAATSVGQVSLTIKMPTGYSMLRSGSLRADGGSGGVRLRGRPAEVSSSEDVDAADQDAADGLGVVCASLVEGGGARRGAAISGHAAVRGAESKGGMRRAALPDQVFVVGVVRVPGVVVMKEPESPVASDLSFLVWIAVLLLLCIACAICVVGVLWVRAAVRKRSEAARVGPLDDASSRVRGSALGDSTDGDKRWTLSTYGGDAGATPTLRMGGRRSLRREWKRAAAAASAAEAEEWAVVRSVRRGWNDAVGWLSHKLGAPSEDDGAEGGGVSLMRHGGDVVSHEPPPPLPPLEHVNAPRAMAWQPSAADERIRQHALRDFEGCGSMNALHGSGGGGGGGARGGWRGGGGDDSRLALDGRNSDELGEGRGRPSGGRRSRSRGGEEGVSASPRRDRSSRRRGRHGERGKGEGGGGG